MVNPTLKMPTKEEVHAERKANFKAIMEENPEVSRYPEIIEMLRRSELLVGD